VRPLILIGSTDSDYFLLLEHILEADGFDTVFGKSVEEIVHLGRECNPYAILLDSWSGSLSASSACVRLKDDPRTAGILTIALIGPGAESQYVDLLKAGIDESFVRPLAPSKLLEFLRSRARRSGRYTKKMNGDASLFYAGIELNLETHRVKRNGVDIHLGPIEFKLLQHLLRNCEQVCGRGDLVAYAWPQNIHVEPRTVNVHIGRLRKALSLDGAPDLIRTVRSAGYALDGGSVVGTPFDAKGASSLSPTGSDITQSE
jgi:two-component system phosphate regulon response regulator PhoB